MSKKTIENIFKVMAGTGNVGYLWEHVSYFEKAVPAEIAPFSDLASPGDIGRYAYRECHNFSAWIRLFAELISNKALTRLSHNELCEKGPADLNFGRTVRTIIEKASEVAKKRGIPLDRLEAMGKSLMLVIELRHSLQHGGLPSLLRTKPQIPGVDLQEVAAMAVPQNFANTKQIFYDANRILELLPTKVIRIRQGGEVEFLK